MNVIKEVTFMKYFVQRESDMKLRHVCSDRSEANKVKDWVESQTGTKHFVYYGGSELVNHSVVSKLTRGAVKASHMLRGW